MFSQNLEEKFILEYFGDFKGRLIDVGSNDGVTFSNSRQLILNDWSAVLVEPSPKAFERLAELYKGYEKATLHNVAISYFSGKSTLYESGAHAGDNVGLLSSLNPEEVKRWKKESFYTVEITCKTIPDLFKDKQPDFHFVTIDAEGSDVYVLSQLNLKATLLVCVEHNSNKATEDIIKAYCEDFGINKVIYRNAENIIIGR